MSWVCGRKLEPSGEIPADTVEQSDHLNPEPACCEVTVPTDAPVIQPPMYLVTFEMTKLNFIKGMGAADTNSDPLLQFTLSIKPVNKYLCSHICGQFNLCYMLCPNSMPTCA